MDKFNGKQVTILVMNREGHAEHTVGFDDALNLVREEMGKGKWMRVVNPDGTSHIETSFETLTADMDKFTNDFMNAQQLVLVAALQGGAAAAEPTIMIDGKVYRLSQVKVNTDSDGRVTAVAAPKPEEPKVTTGVKIYSVTGDDTILRVSCGDENEIEITLNNAHGIETVARGIAHLARFLDMHWESMRDGDMTVDDGK